MERLILARHAESVASKAGVANGNPALDRGLTAHGREQARELGRALRDRPIDLCVTSRFPRAKETASLALAEWEAQRSSGNRRAGPRSSVPPPRPGGSEYPSNPIPRIVLADLDDLRFDRFEGKPLEEYRAWARAHPIGDAPANGESRVALAARYCRAMRDLLGRPETDILVVAHGLPLTYVVAVARGELPQRVMSYLEPATPYVLTARKLASAIDRLEAWAQEPATP